ncbi:carbohydrate kinase family protein [Litoreibacter arenae]|uniref:Fructokinase n=1 Tax=Litoreibacter arenae DSM 19593 TaxID=1123360 RepID=S9QN96_9RHOB|nr:carbohydrate kinase [Litoreibacter arenae]EPX81162.1 Fructokinase [Litoreibacter arenae DSM 19593]
MILCCGEALIDMLPRVTAGGEHAFAPYAGGAVFNTAIALGRLGTAPGFFCGLSTDLFGELLETKLAEAGVSSALAPRSDRPTTLAFVRLTDGHATYTFYDENSAMRMMTEADLPALPDDISALFFGGISLVGEPCGTAFQALMAREAASRVTMIDPNIRPSFITDRAAYVARVKDMMALSDVVKLSDEDMHWLEGDGDLADLAQDLIARGTKVVLITEGAKGATGYTAAHTVFVAANKVEVVDTVGAGDTFNAGFLAGLQKAGALDKATLADLSQNVLHDALSLGIRTAAITVSRAGANPPWENEL